MLKDEFLQYPVNHAVLLCLQGLINNERGMFYNTATHQEIPISQALNQGLIVGQLVSSTEQHEVFRSALAASRISTDTALVSVMNPLTGRAIYFENSFKNLVVIKKYIF